MWWKKAPAPRYVTHAQLAEIREDLSGLQADHRLLLHEWEETHRKLLNALRSMNRAGGKKAPAEESPSEGLTAAGVPSGVDPISAGILARRRAARVVQNEQSEATG
jgi:hypothetical protein